MVKNIMDVKNEIERWSCMVLFVFIMLILANNLCFKVSMRRNMKKKTIYDHLVAKCSLDDLLLFKLAYV